MEIAKTYMHTQMLSFLLHTPTIFLLCPDIEMTKQDLLGNTVVTELDGQNLVGSKQVIPAFQGFVVFTRSVLTYFIEKDDGVKHEWSLKLEGDLVLDISFLPELRLLCLLLIQSDSENRMYVNLLDEDLTEVSRDFDTTVNDDSAHPTYLLDLMLLEKSICGMYTYIYFEHDTNHLGVIFDSNKALSTEYFNDDPNVYKEFICTADEVTKRIKMVPKFDYLRKTTPQPGVDPIQLKDYLDGVEVNGVSQNGTMMALITEKGLVYLDQEIGIIKGIGADACFSKPLLCSRSESYWFLNGRSLDTISFFGEPTQPILQTENGTLYPQIATTSRHIILFNEKTGLELYDKDTFRASHIKNEEMLVGADANVINYTSHMLVLPDGCILRCYLDRKRSLIVKERPSAFNREETTETARIVLTGRVMGMYSFNKNLTLISSSEGVYMIDNDTLHIVAFLAQTRICKEAYDPEYEYLVISCMEPYQLFLIKFDTNRNVFVILQSVLTPAHMKSMDHISKRIYFQENSVMPYNFGGILYKDIFESRFTYCKDKYFKVPNSPLIACFSEDNKIDFMSKKGAKGEKVISSFEGRDLFQLKDGNFVFLDGQSFFFYHTITRQWEELFDFSFSVPKLGDFEVLWFNPDIIRSTPAGSQQYDKGLLAFVRSERTMKVHSIYIKETVN